MYYVLISFSYIVSLAKKNKKQRLTPDNKSELCRLFFRRLLSSFKCFELSEFLKKILFLVSSGLTDFFVLTA